MRSTEEGQACGKPISNTVNGRHAYGRSERHEGFVMQFQVQAVRRSTGRPVLFTLSASTAGAAMAEASAMGYRVESVTPRRAATVRVADEGCVADASPLSVMQLLRTWCGDAAQHEEAQP